MKKKTNNYTDDINKVKPPKKKKKIFRKIVIGILVVVIIIFGKYKINSYIMKANDKKIVDKIGKVEIPTYVFVEINPSIVLEIINNKVKSIACLNEDCKKITTGLDMRDYKLSESIEILYNMAKDQGFDVSNGVRVKSVNRITMMYDNKIKVEFELIDSVTESEKLKNVIDNTTLLSNKEKSNEELLAIYKSDKDYGKYYTCKITSELECYFIEGSLPNDPWSNDSVLIIEQREAIRRVLDKFKVPMEVKGKYTYIYLYDIKLEETWYGFDNDPYRYVFKHGNTIIEVKNLNLANPNSSRKCDCYAHDETEDLSE